MHRIRLVRTGILGLVAALLVLPLAGPAAAFTTDPTPGVAPGVSTTGADVLRTFYRTTNGGLMLKTNQVAGSSTLTYLGGQLSTGAAAVTTGTGISQRTWAFAAGGNGAVYYRLAAINASAVEEWGPWSSLGGFTAAAPAASCTSAAGPPVIWIRGGDGALWRRTTYTPWKRIGGSITSAPAAVPAGQGVCPTAEDVVALGADKAVWEHRDGTWTKVGGQSNFLPTIVRYAGVVYAFVVGTNGALYVADRPAAASVWSAFAKIGWKFTSGPAAQIWGEGSPQATLSVQVLSTDSTIYRASKVIGSPAGWVLVTL